MENNIPDLKSMTPAQRERWMIDNVFDSKGNYRGMGNMTTEATKAWDKAVADENIRKEAVKTSKYLSDRYRAFDRAETLTIKEMGIGKYNYDKLVKGMGEDNVKKAGITLDAAAHMSDEQVKGFIDRTNEKQGFFSKVVEEVTTTPIKPTEIASVGLGISVFDVMSKYKFDTIEEDTGSYLADNVRKSFNETASKEFSSGFFSSFFSPFSKFMG